MNGVKSGDTLGDLQWTPEVIPSSVHCATEWVFIIPVRRCKSNNVQHVVNATGLSAVQYLNYYWGIGWECLCKWNCFPTGYRITAPLCISLHARLTGIRISWLSIDDWG